MSLSCGRQRSAYLEHWLEQFEKTVDHDLALLALTWRLLLYWHLLLRFETDLPARLLPQFALNNIPGKLSLVLHLLLLNS